MQRDVTLNYRGLYQRRWSLTLLSSLPGLTPQVGLARLAALNNAELGQARVPMQSIILIKKLFF